MSTAARFHELPIARVSPEAAGAVAITFAIPPEQYATIEDHLKSHGVEVLYSETREGGTVNGPRTYFRDPDGTRLEFIHLTSYDPTAQTKPKVTAKT